MHNKLTRDIRSFIPKGKLGAYNYWVLNRKAELSKKHTETQQLTASVCGGRTIRKLDTIEEKVKNRKHMAAWDTGQTESFVNTTEENWRTPGDKSLIAPVCWPNSKIAVLSKHYYSEVKLTAEQTQCILFFFFFFTLLFFRERPCPHKYRF